MTELVEKKLAGMDDSVLLAVEKRARNRKSDLFEVAQFEPQEGPEFLSRLHSFRIASNVHASVMDEITNREIVKSIQKQQQGEK